MRPEWIIFGGLLHFSVLVASALVPGVLDWKGELARLHPLTRQVVWVHGGYIVLTIVALGLLSIALPNELVDRSPLSRAVCGFIAVFWTLRLLLQFIYFDAGDHLNRWWLKLGYGILTVVFFTLGAIYAAAAVLPGYVQ